MSDMSGGTPASREVAAARLVNALAAAAPGSEVVRIGSLATPERADVFSDIDLRWVIPAGRAAAPLRTLRRTLEQLGHVESLRLDPDVRPDVLLVFARFDGWPLWWRVDLEVHSPGLAPADLPDADAWSPHESACMGVLVTVKVLARGRDDDAEVLFARARERLDAGDVAGEGRQRIDSLLDHIATSSPDTADLVSRTQRDVGAGARDDVGPPVEQERPRREALVAAHGGIVPRQVAGTHRQPARPLSGCGAGRSRGLRPGPRTDGPPPWPGTPGTPPPRARPRRRGRGRR